MAQQHALTSGAMQTARSVRDLPTPAPFSVDSLRQNMATVGAASRIVLMSLDDQRLDDRSAPEPVNEALIDDAGNRSVDLARRQDEAAVEIGQFVRDGVVGLLGGRTAPVEHERGVPRPGSKVACGSRVSLPSARVHRPHNLPCGWGRRAGHRLTCTTWSDRPGHRATPQAQAAWRERAPRRRQSSAGHT